MLCFDPRRRISSADVLKHEFFNDINQDNEATNIQKDGGDVERSNSSGKLSQKTTTDVEPIDFAQEEKRESLGVKLKSNVRFYHSLCMCVCVCACV